jgi:uncharacterized protein
MARVVIADAGPLIAFAAVDRLPILKALFSEVIITPSVRSECAAKPGADTRRIDAAIADGWLVVRTLESPVTPLSPSLGRGESDSIHLAIADPDNTLLILDDRLARRYALKRGLSVVGTARLLHVAEQLGLIGDAARCVQEMAEVGYRISPALLDRIRSADSGR